MTTKSFQAETIMEALQKVQQEMGPDAVVISARDIPIGPAWQVWKKPGVEVISVSPDELQKVKGKNKQSQQTSRFIRPGSKGSGVEFIEERPSIEWDSAVAQKVQTHPAQPKLNPGIPVKRTNVSELQELWKPRYLHKEDVQALNQLLAGHSQSLDNARGKQESKTLSTMGQNSNATIRTDAGTCPRTLEKLLDKLKLQGIDREYITQLENLALKGCSPATIENGTRMKEFLVGLMSANLPTMRWPATEVPARVMIFVGLSGSGKTSALAKVAIFYSSLLGKKVVWVCADTIKTGAINEARAYSGILNIPVELAYSASDLTRVVKKYPDADLILIDTAGFNPSAEEQEVELGSFLTEVPTAQIFLATSATTQETDALHCFDSLKFFGLKGSVITKLDETVSYGSVLNFTQKSGVPLTFFTNSPKVSTGLQVANADFLVEALFNGRF